MYVPPAFQENDTAALHAAIRATKLATLITATTEGLIGTPLPMIFDAAEGPCGTLYGHVARANPQWKHASISDAMAVFMGPDAYVTPSWYATKRETGKVVPTWNYVAVHAYGPVEFFEDADRLLDVVTPNSRNFTRVHALTHGPSPMRQRSSFNRSCAASSACACRSPASMASAR